MRKLFLIVLFSFLLIVPFVSAIPDAPALIWFTGNENPPFDNDGTFTVNWDPVTNEGIARYNIYLTESSSGLQVLVGSNTTPTTFLFSGYSYGNYTFNVTAVNVLDEEGSGALSDWVYVYTTLPTITFRPPTPKNNAYTKENWTTISGIIEDPFLDTMIINWNGADNYYHYPSGTLWMYTFEMPSTGKYTYYVWANDSATNSIKSEVRSITYDITKPSVSIISPKQDSVYNTSLIPLEYAASDSSTISCWYEYNLINNTLVDCHNTSFIPVFGNKTNLTVWVSDAAGNLNSAPVFFTANTPPAPNIVSTIPENNKVLEAPSITGRTDTILSIKTDREAQCLYSLQPNTTFELMPNGFSYAGPNMLNATVSIADKTYYTYYVRCKSVDGAVTSADYVIKFSTAAPEGLIIFDPDKTILRNNVLTIKAIQGVSSSVNVPAKTRAFYGVSNFKVSLSGDAAPYLQVQLPPVITNDRLSNITIAVISNVLGESKANISISLGEYNYILPVEAFVYEDFLLDLNALESGLSNISLRIAELNSIGANVADKTSELERIRSEVLEIRTLYGSGSPYEAKELYLQLKDSVTLLNDRVFANTQQVGNFSSLNTTTEDTSDSDSGGISLTVIVIVIIVVIVIIIVATSYVPDNGEVAAPAAVPAPENPVGEYF